LSFSQVHCRIAAIAFVLPASCDLFAQSAGDAVTVTGTRVERPSMEVPASIDRVEAEDIRFARPQINLSESLGRVPGIVVQNRQNYAQDLQISSRGFGGRSTFGVRGLRLITDGIPASFPDGQGQVSHFDLSSAQSIEVLRGPFSVMYGNAAGGVINLTTESGASYGEGGTAAGAELSLGSFGTSRAGVKAGGRNGGTDWILSTSHFHTDGYRQHSAADRDLLNAKISLAPSPGASLTLVANSFNSPEVQDPLGLTRAQLSADPRQVDPNAITFNTRKTVSQSQAGAAYMQRFSDWTLNAAAYAGHRDVRQYLAIPLTPTGQNATTSSGGVVDLDRDYGGATLRLTREVAFFDRPLTLNIGGEAERMVERRKGFINNNGGLTDLKRNEDDYVTSIAAYAQAEWRPAERWIASAGVRANTVAFKSSDYFVLPGTANLDDSGSRNYAATTPFAGLLYRITPAASVYVNAGRGFETPTFAEIAYKSSTTASGLNFGLNAARSRHLEVGVKALIAERLRVNAALFDVMTHDEIAIATNSGGRATFRNAGRTHRGGFELGAEATLPHGFEAYLAWTLLEAKFLDTFTTASGTPAQIVTVASGNHLPGVPSSMLYAEMRWRHAPSGFTAALEYQHKSRVFADDFNSQSADAYGVVNFAAGFVQRAGAWRFSEYLRLDNLANKRYVGSVVVNDANLRFYEPAPGRNYMIGAQAKLGF
jgi:iron complex outermembrane receptor protein